MRVALVCDWFLRYVRPLAIALADAGADVALVCRDHALEYAGSATERDDAIGEIASTGAAIFVVPGRISSAPDLPAAGGALRRLARWQPDIVHAQDNADPRLLAAALGHPTVLTIHDPIPHPGAPPRPLGGRAVRAAWARKASRIVVHGDALREELAARTRRPGIVVVVPHGAEVLDEPLPRPGEPRVLFFGRLERYKGLPVLVEAMRAVWQARPEARLEILGAGPYAAELPADERIEQTIGYVPEASVDAAFRRASVVALPYVQASQSGVGLLALARGIPTVVTRVGSLPELAADRSLVVAPGDVADLARAILRHLDHGDALRRATLELAQRRFAWDVVARRTLDVYDDALAGRRAA